MTALALALLMPNVDRNPSRMEPDELRDWLAMCRWIRESAPKDSVFVTPAYSYAFKWHAERPEYVSNKDVPQDAARIKEWQTRRVQIAVWRKTAAPRGYPPVDLRELRQITRAAYFVARRDLVRGSDPAFRNGTFEVYRLP